MATMIDTDKYDIVKSAFRFTTEGRHLLISQEGGIKFAILGYMFVQSDKLESFENLDDYIQALDEYAKANKLTLMEAMQDKTFDSTCKFIMKNVNYKIQSTNRLKPISDSKYNEALTNYSENLFGIYYVPTNEFMLKKTESGKEIPYGLYRFNFDRTYLSCKITQDLCFSHIVLIGKQYAETDDATFNVNEVQDASIVAFARFDGQIERSTGIYSGGVQLLANQNKYVSFQTQLRFTVREDDEDISPEKVGDEWNFDIPSAVSGTAQKLYLVNNGVKTLSGGVAIGYDKEVLDELQLDQDGAIAIDKSLVVADCIDADDAENQFNGTALVHAINKYPEDGGKYIPQYLLTTIKATSSLKEDIEAYCVGMQLNGIGNNPYSLMGADKAPESPTFLLGHLPENDFVCVDIFGRDNFNTQYNSDRYLFSFDNSATEPGTKEPNVLIRSHGNSFRYGSSNMDNFLLGSNKNRYSYGVTDTYLFDSEYNKLTNGLKDAFLAYSDYNSVSSVNGLLMINSDSNHIKDSANMNSFYDSRTNSAFDNAQNNLFLFSNSNALSGNANSNILFKAQGCMVDQNSRYNYLEKMDGSHISWDTAFGAFKNSNHLSALASYYDVVNTSNYTYMRDTSQNKVYNAFRFSGFSAQNNIINGARHFGLYPNGSTSISGVERPLASDNMSNNNYVMNSTYAILFGCSDNILVNNYGLRAHDSVVDPGPIRVKGSTIIGSDGSKLYNTREMTLLNSTYSRIDGHSNYTDQQLKLNGTSWAISQFNQGILDSILAGEASGGSGLSGTSYRDGAESISVHGRPADMLKMRAMFINSYGSELNLSEFIPSEHYTYGSTYSPYTAFKDQNRSVMEDVIKPHNSVIIGGHHTKMTGGENVIALGAEFSKASGKSHQILMGKYNRNVPADMVFGCGHFAADSYTQNEKEYSIQELKTIETMQGTIDNIRNSSILQNAMEFYAHQGKMILRNCDDGFDRNGGAKSDAYGMTVSIDPTGLIFRDRNDQVIGEMFAGDLEKDSETFIYIDWEQGKGTHSTEGKYLINEWSSTCTEFNKYFNSLNAQDRFDALFYMALDTNGYYRNKTIANPDSTNDRFGFNVGSTDPGDIFKVNIDLCKAMFDNQGIQNLTIIFRETGNLRNNVTTKQVRDAENQHMYLRIIPWYTQPGQHARFVSKNPVKLKIINADLYLDNNNSTKPGIIIRSPNESTTWGSTKTLICGAGQYKIPESYSGPVFYSLYTSYKTMIRNNSGTWTKYINRMGLRVLDTVCLAQAKNISAWIPNDTDNIE